MSERAVGSRRSVSLRGQDDAVEDTHQSSEQLFSLPVPFGAAPIPALSLNKTHEKIHHLVQLRGSRLSWRLVLCRICSGCLPLCHFVHFKWLGMVVLILIIPVLFFWIPLIFELYVNLPSGSRRIC